MRFFKVFLTDIYIDLFVFLGFWIYAGLGWQTDTSHVLGVLLSIVATIAWIISRIQLGKNFEVLPVAKSLKTHGIYSKIKHPIYVFSTIAYLGIFIATKDFFIGVMFIFIVFIQIWRARRENKILKKNFSDYDEYSKEVWF